MSVLDDVIAAAGSAFDNALAAIVGAATGPLDARITALAASADARVTTIETGVAALNASVAALSTSVTALATTVSEQGTAAAAIDARMTALDARVTALEPPPPPPPPPPPDPHSGEVTRIVPLGPYRAGFFGPNSYWKRRLPDAGRPIFQHPTQPLANSANWVSSLCAQMGFSNNPGTLTSVYAPGVPVNQGNAWLGREDQHLYIVPADQQYRPFTNIQAATDTFAARFNAVVDRLGGLPVPLDATAHKTADRYLHVYKPDAGLFASLYACAALDPAKVTFTLTGSPEFGGVTLRLWYGDNELAPTWYTTGTIPYDATAAQVDAAVDAAKSSTGVALGAGNANRCVATGGPLNAAPVVLEFSIATPLEPVNTEILTSTLNRGELGVTVHASGPLDRCRAGGIITPDASGYTGVAEHGGTYSDRQVAELWWEDKNWGGAATGMEFMAGTPSWDEYAAALVAGTDLGHSVVLNVGHCQASPVPYVWPARRGDGDKTNNPGYIAEGAHLALPSSYDLSWHQANYPEWMPMLRTLKSYGCRVPDKTGGGCGLNLRRASWPGSSFNPWFDLLPRYATATNASHIYMKAIPWADMQVIDPEWSR